MPVHDVCADPETQTRSTDPLRREECVVHLALYLLIHAGARIRKRENQPFTARSPVRALTASNEKMPSVRHCIDSICNDIAKDLTNISLKTLDRLIRTLAFFDR